MKTTVGLLMLTSAVGVGNLVYVVRRHLVETSPLYVGKSGKALSWRMKRHFGDSNSQECSALSTHLRKGNPESKEWTVEALDAWTASERYGEATANLAKAERITARALKPLEGFGSHCAAWLGSDPLPERRKRDETTGI